MSEKIIPMGGPCCEVCSVKRDPRTGKLVSTGQCTHERLIGLRETAHGPRAVVRPCTHHPVQRTDALDARRRKAREQIAAVDRFVSARASAKNRTPEAVARRAAAAKALAADKRLRCDAVKVGIARATRNATLGTLGRRRLDADEKPDAPVLLPGMVDTFNPSARTAVLLVSVPEGARLDVRRLETNGAVLWGGDLGELPIGTAEKLEKVEGELLGISIRFAMSDLADQICSGIRESMIRAGALMCTRAEDGTLEAFAVTLSSVAPAEPEPEAEPVDDQADDERTTRTRGQAEDEEKALAAHLAEQRKAYSVRMRNMGRRAEEQEPRPNASARQGEQHADAIELDPVTKARQENEARARSAWHVKGGRR